MKNHFVPQFLLKAWSKGAEDGKVQEFRLDLEGIPTSRRAPKATAYERNLYALTQVEVAGMSQHAIETQFLTRIDSDAAVVRMKMVTKGLRGLSLEERHSWVLFLSSLRIRQPDIIGQLTRSGALHLNQKLETFSEEFMALDEHLPPLAEWLRECSPA